MRSLKEEIARLVDQDGYWQRMDGCNHALNTVSMSDDQRRQLTEVRDDEHRLTSESNAVASAILALIRDRLLSEEAVKEASVALIEELPDLMEVEFLVARAALLAAMDRIESPTHQPVSGEVADG